MQQQKPSNEYTLEDLKKEKVKFRLQFDVVMEGYPMEITNDAVYQQIQNEVMQKINMIRNANPERGISLRIAGFATEWIEV